MDTGATTSCCRWGWYKKWKSHLGPMRHSSTMAVSVGNVPIEVKGLSKPLMLEWDSIEGQCRPDGLDHSEGRKCYSRY